MRNKTYIIAEAGVNHNGSAEMAKELVRVAAKAGADAVKFQTFKAERLATESAEKAEYQKRATGYQETQFEMLKRLELNHGLHHELISLAEELGIDFLSTAFDSESLKFLVNDLGLSTLKIPSGELTNAPLLLEHARTGCDLIISTGMASLGEVEEMLGVVAFGLSMPPGSKPSRAAFSAAYMSEKGQKMLKRKVTLLHCTTEYPAPYEEINLRAMDTLTRSFGLPVGYSDHSEGLAVPVAATALGACLVEKHFTLDRNLEGPDHKASVEPQELEAMVRAIRQVEASLGDGVKGARASELKNKDIARKSLVAAVDVKAGDTFTEENLTVKRPGNGVSPMEFWSLLGKQAERDLRKNEVVS